MTYLSNKLIVTTFLITYSFFTCVSLVFFPGLGIPFFVSQLFLAFVFFLFLPHSTAFLQIYIAFLFPQLVFLLEYSFLYKNLLFEYLTIITVFFVYLFSSKGFSYLTIHISSFFDFILVFLMIIAGSVIGLLAHWVLFTEPINSDQSLSFLFVTSALFSFLLELFFRNHVQNQLGNLFSPFVTILLTSMIYAMFFLPGGVLYSMFAFGISVLLSTFFELKRNVLFTMVFSTSLFFVYSLQLGSIQL